MTRSLMSLWQLKNEDTEVWNDMFVLFSGGGHVFCGVFRLMEDRWFFNAQSSLRTPLQANCQTAILSSIISDNYAEFERRTHLRDL